MSHFKRAGAALLALLLLLPTFAACSEKQQDEGEPDKAAVTTQTPSAEEFPEEEDDGKSHYYENLEAADYGGWTFNIANDGLSAEYYSGFTVEELTGDVFSDDLYNRQIAVQDKYNIVISENHNGSVNGIKQCVTSGTGDVAFGYVLSGSCMGLITGNYVLPVSDLPTIDLTKPYWDQGSQKNLTFFGKMYYGYPDIGWDHYESVAVLFYNGWLLTNNSVQESPYDLYMEGKWTLDAMYDMINVVVRDEDGDGKMVSGKDTFGWSGREFEYLPSLYASNLRLVYYDEEAEAFVMNISQESVMAVGNMLGKIINDKNLSVPGRNDETRNMFKDGKCLFYSRLLGDFRNLRDKEDDYGIICYPSLEENTEGMVYCQQPYTVMVPSDCEDTERLGTILEALAAYTYDNVLDDYINKTVIGKGARDEQSAQLLRKFITIRAFDLSYAIADFSAIDAYGIGVKNGNYASAEKRSAKGFEKKTAKIVEALKGKD
ncbi:MAG: extracellular solute-binding protein [Clostridia bacterium]|nr:extracellular solute-binding protein [Clostridia bacterium]